MDGLERSCSISRNEKRDFADGKLRPLISTQRLRNLVPVISLLFLRSCIAYASVTCRFDRLGPIGWRVFDSCLPRNGGATFQYRTIPRFINIHSWNEVIYICVHIIYWNDRVCYTSIKLCSFRIRAPTGRNDARVPSKLNRFIGKNW